MVKKEYLVQELGLEAVELMRRIKVLTPTHLKLISQLALDPLELLNPGLTPLSSGRKTNVLDKVVPAWHYGVPITKPLKKGGMTNAF
jgi:hypothetical protein